MSVTELPMNMGLIKADIVIADSAIKEAKKTTPILAKAMRGQAGFHLQQAAEKMIKIQLYASGKKLELHKVYKHSLDDLMLYAKEIGTEIIIPKYVFNNSVTITSWEAAGRYDVHRVVRITQLEKCYSEIVTWFDELKKQGYK